jgi:hypothetical protein
VLVVGIAKDPSAADARIGEQHGEYPITELLDRVKFVEADEDYCGRILLSRVYAF